MLPTVPSLQVLSNINLASVIVNGNSNLVTAMEIPSFLPILHMGNDIGHLIFYMFKEKQEFVNNINTIAALMNMDCPVIWDMYGAIDSKRTVECYLLDNEHIDVTTRCWIAFIFCCESRLQQLWYNCNKPLFKEAYLAFIHHNQNFSHSYLILQYWCESFDFQLHCAFREVSAKDLLEDMIVYNIHYPCIYLWNQLNPAEKLEMLQFIGQMEQMNHTTFYILTRIISRRELGDAISSFYRFRFKLLMWILDDVRVHYLFHNIFDYNYLDASLTLDEWNTLANAIGSRLRREGVSDSLKSIWIEICTNVV